jgi:hypothetical protein
MNEISPPALDAALLPVMPVDDVPRRKVTLKNRLVVVEHWPARSRESGAHLARQADGFLSGLLYRRGRKCCGSQAEALTYPPLHVRVIFG